MNKLLGQKTLNGKIINLGAFPLMKYSLIQGVGDELNLNVKVGDSVKIGSLLATCNQNMLGASLHSSISGKVELIKKEEIEKDANATVVFVKNDNKNEKEKPLNPLDDLSVKALCGRLDECGVIGFGGGGFPLSLKLEKFVANAKNVKDKYIFINCASSEGFYTADIAVLKEECDKVIKATEILSDATGCKNIVLVFRKGTRKYLKDVLDKIAYNPLINVAFMPNKIGIGDEKIIAQKVVIGSKIDEGEVLTDYGLMCVNIQTMCAFYDAVVCGLPCISRVVTCSGGALKTPCNARVLIGTIYEDVVEAIGGEIFPLAKFKALEDSATNDYSSYLSIREEYNDDTTNEEIKKQMVEMRKKSNASILEFLKAEKLHSHYLTDTYLSVGYLSGVVKEDYYFSVTKTTLEILLLTKTEAKTREKLLKKYKIN